MRLWSIWDEAQHDFFMRHRYLVASWEHVDSDFLYQYRWISRFARRRPAIELATPDHDTESSPPVWAWYAYGGMRAPKPDLNDSGFLPEGSVGYCVELSIDERDVLLTQFNMWCMVLSNHFITDSDAEDDDRTASEDFLSEQAIQTRKEETWARIFDLKFGSVEWWGNFDERAIQACISHIQEADVVEITRFIAK